MTLDDEVLKWLYVQDSKAMQESHDSDGLKTDHSAISVLGSHKYLLGVLLVVLVTLPLTITALRNVRQRKDKNERSPSGICVLVAAVLGRPRRRSTSNITAAGTADYIRSRLRFWEWQANPSARQISARRSRLTISKNSPSPEVGRQTRTAAVSANIHGYPSNSHLVLGNDSANKATKVPDYESHTNLAANIITFTTNKASLSQLKTKASTSVAPAFKRTGNLIGREGSSCGEDRYSSRRLAHEVSECCASGVDRFNVTVSSKRERGREYRKRTVENTNNRTNKQLDMAIDTFGEISCFMTDECQDSISTSRNHEKSSVEGYDFQPQSNSRADVAHNETKISDPTSGRHAEEQISQISVEDSTNALKISLRDEQFVPVHRNKGKTTNDAPDCSRYFQDQENAKGDWKKSDLVMSANDAAKNLMSGNLSPICRKCSSIRQDNRGTDSRMSASTGCRGLEGRVAYSELHRSRTNKKTPQWTSCGAKTADHGVQKQATVKHCRSSDMGALSRSDDHSWSFTPRNPVFEDRYTSFMRVSSSSKEKTSRLRRTVQLEPRPSKKLIEKTKFEKLRFQSEQWSDEMLRSKDRMPKLACLLLHPDDYLLEHGKQIGAQKVYTKDGFKFIVPLTFVSYGNKKKRVLPLSEETNDDLDFSLSNLSDDTVDSCRDDVSGLHIRRTDDVVSGEDGLEERPRKSGKPANMGRSSSHLSSMYAEDVDQECGPINCYDNHELSRIVKTNLPGNSDFQDGTKQNETDSTESVTPALRIVNSSGQTNETKYKEINRISCAPVCVDLSNSENTDTVDVTPNFNDLIRKGNRRRAVELPRRPGTGTGYMKNVSRWLSGVSSYKSPHSTCSSSSSFGLKGSENLAGKQITRVHSCSDSDCTSSDSGNRHRPLQNPEKQAQLNCHPLAHKYIPPGILQSHVARKGLARDVGHSSSRSDEDASSHSNISFSLASILKKHGAGASVTRRQSQFRTDDDTQFVRESYVNGFESVNDLEKDKHDVSRKHEIFNKQEIPHHKYRHYLNTGDMDKERKKPDRVEKPIRKLVAGQDRFQCTHFHQDKRLCTDSLGNVSVPGSAPISFKGLGKLNSKSPAFAHLPLFNNRHEESVNIIVRLESSAQKNLIEKHKHGSLMNAAVAAGNSCLPGDSGERLLRNNQTASETPVMNSARRCPVDLCDVTFGNREDLMKDFGGQKKLKEVAQMKPKKLKEVAQMKQKKQEFDDSTEGSGLGQLHCAVLSTKDRGLMSLKRFTSNIQEEDTVYVNDIAGSKDRTNFNEDLTNLDQNSDPASIQLPMKRGTAKDKLTTSAADLSVNEDLNMVRKSNTEHNPTYKVCYESTRINLEQSSVEKYGYEPVRNDIAHKNRTLNTKLFTKWPHKDKKHNQHYHVSSRDDTQDLVKNYHPNTQTERSENTKSNLDVGDRMSYSLQKQEKTIQNEAPNRTTEQESVLLVDGGIKMAASNCHTTNTKDCGKIKTEEHLKASRMDSSRVTTSSHAIKFVGNSTQLPSDLDNKELGEDFKGSFLQFPGDDNCEQTNTVTNNKQVGLVKQTFRNISEHLPQTTHRKYQHPQQHRDADLLKDQHPQQNRDADLLNKPTATQTETIPALTANSRSRNTDPHLTDRKTQDSEPKEETEHPQAVTLFNQHLSQSRKLLQASGTPDHKDIPKKMCKLKADGSCPTLSTKNKTDRMQKQVIKLCENADIKETDRCGTAMASVEEISFSSIFKNHRSQKERCTEKQDDLNITYSKENINNLPQVCNSSVKSQEGGHFSKQKQKYKPTYDGEGTLQARNHTDHKKCRNQRPFPNKSGSLIGRMKKYQMLTKPKQEPTKYLQNPNGQEHDATDCSSTHKQTLEKTKSKPESPNDETNKSLQLKDKITSPHFPQIISKKHFSSKKADLNSFSQSVIAEKTKQTNGKVNCKLSAHSLTFNTDNIHKQDYILQSQVKSNMKGNRTNKQPSSLTKEVEDIPETTSRLNSTLTNGAKKPRNLQDLNARHNCPRPRVSNQVDSVTSGIDVGLKSTAQCKLRKQSNLQHILFKKMFKFCAGDDTNCFSRHQTDSAAALETPQSKRLREFSDRINSRKPRDIWTVKQFSEALKIDTVKENKTGPGGRAGSQHPHSPVSKNWEFTNENSASIHSEKSKQTTDTYPHKYTQTSCEGGKTKEQGFPTCADIILDDNDDCRLPDRLPEKIGGSTEVSSADTSDLVRPKGGKQLPSVEDESPTEKHDCKSTSHVNVDELREKYLREMTQKGLFRNGTFDIINEKKKVNDEDPEDMTLISRNNQRTFSSDTTIIKSPVPLESRKMAALSRSIGFHTSDICCNGWPNNLKRKREDYKYEGLNAARKGTSHDNKSLVEISSNDKLISKDTPDKQFVTSSTLGRLPKATLKNNKVTTDSHNDMPIMKNCCPQPKSYATMKKLSGSHENYRLHRPINPERLETVEHPRDSSTFTGLCRHLEMSDSISPSSTTANIPMMGHSELMSQTCLPSAGRGTHQASDPQFNSMAEDNAFSTTEDHQYQDGQPKYVHQSSKINGLQQFAGRKPSQIPRMKRSETSIRMQRSDTRSFSQIQPLLNGNQRATTVKNFQSSSFSKLKTVSIKQNQKNETKFTHQASNDTNKTISEKSQQQTDVNNTRSHDSSTDIIISWFEKENAPDTGQPDTDSDLMSSLHNIPKLNLSYSPSNYTLTTVCGFQGENVPVTNTPDDLVGVPEINKNTGVNRFISQVKGNTSERFDCKSQGSREQGFESMSPERSLGKHWPENINLRNSNEELTTTREDSNKIPFWQKHVRSKSIKTDNGVDRNKSWKNSTRVQAKESKDKLASSSHSERHPCKVESLIKAFNNRCPTGNKKQAKTSNINLQEWESKRPAPANMALHSQLRTMRNVAKNRKYVSSALMYTMKKQSGTLPNKRISDTKQQHSMLKTPAVSTNNSAVLDKRDVYPKNQVPTNAVVHNSKARVSNSFVKTCPLKRTVHKNTTDSNVHLSRNPNAIYFNSVYEPACKQMRMDVTKSESSRKHSSEEYVQGSADSFNRKPAAERIQSKCGILPVTVSFSVEGGHASVHANEDAQNKQEESEENNHGEDIMDEQNQGPSSENCPSNVSACTASDSTKVSFDWYKPSATNTASAAEHPQDPVQENQRRCQSDQHRLEPDNSEEISHLQQSFLCHDPVNHGELNYSTNLFEETRSVFHESLSSGRSWNLQEFRQANITSSRPNIWSGTMPGSRRVSDDETHEYTQMPTQVLPEPYMDTSSDCLFQRSSGVLPFDVARNPQHRFNHTRLNQPVNTAWPNLHKNQPSKNCQTSDAGPVISESRHHYRSNIPQSGPRPYRRSEYLTRAPAASLSNLNALYEHLQQNYNQANAVYHYNWVLANQNKRLNDSETIPGHLGCCTNYKSNTGDTHHNLLFEECFLEPHNNFTRPHIRPCCQHITPNSIFYPKPSLNDPCIKFGHGITNNLITEPVPSENRTQHCCHNHDQNFLIGSNNQSLSSHQNIPVNVTRIFHVPPELQVTSNNLPISQLHHSFNNPNDQHNIGHNIQHNIGHNIQHNIGHTYSPPGQPDLATPQYQQSQRWCLGEQTLKRKK